jgi:hypothetical protein
MLLANISVAKKIHEEFSEHALLRKHPAPPSSNYEILVKAAKSKVRFCNLKNRMYVYVLGSTHYTLEFIFICIFIKVLLCVDVKICQ